MAEAKLGDRVQIHYSVKWKGVVFDCSRYRSEPVEFTLGDGQFLSGIDEAVQRMKEGERKTVTIHYSKGYGKHKEERVIKVPKNRLPPELEQDGVVLCDRDGVTAFACVDEVKEDTVVLDCNHPLAGKELTFDIELIKICD